MGVTMIHKFLIKRERYAIKVVLENGADVVDESKGREEKTRNKEERTRNKEEIQELMDDLKRGDVRGTIFIYKQIKINKIIDVDGIKVLKQLNYNEKFDKYDF